MLLKLKVLKKIRSGDISIVYRKWKRPSVKKGSVINSAVGQLKILKVEQIEEERINRNEINKAGYSDWKDLVNDLRKYDGQIFKVTLRYVGEDPRISLREKIDISDTEMKNILSKLDRLDRYSKQGSWTNETLKSIDTYPELRAADLAKKLGRDKDWLKIQIRKLKNMGLTISLEKGYKISPRGSAVLNAIK